MPFVLPGYEGKLVKWELRKVAWDSFYISISCKIPMRINNGRRQYESFLVKMCNNWIFFGYGWKVSSILIWVKVPQVHIHLQLKAQERLCKLSQSCQIDYLNKISSTDESFRFQFCKSMLQLGIIRIINTSWTWCWKKN